MTSPIRWYDKDKYLSAFMVLLQGLEPDVQIEVANDILLNVPRIIEHDFDKFVNIMSEHNPRVYRRWYDFDPTLHSAVEIMQNLSTEQREELINLISDIVITHTHRDFDEMMLQITMAKKDKNEE